MDISVIVPTYNRKDLLKQCLQSLFRQDYPRERFEIIVVDDAPSSAVQEMVEALSNGHSNVRYVAQAHKGPAAARNLGVRVSRGETVGFIDDDCTASPDWVALVMKNHRAHPDVCVIGGLTIVPSQETPVIVSQFLSSCSIETHIRNKREVIFFPTCNVSIKKRIFDEYAFDETFPLPGGEDLEFFWKLFKDGHRFIWDRNMKIMHYRDNTTVGFLKQAHIYGRGNLLVQHIHKDHPLLKELKAGIVSFWVATAINIIKIPRFSYLLGRRLIEEAAIKDAYKKVSIYAYFILHKIAYILGNSAEFFRIGSDSLRVTGAVYHTPRLLIFDITHACNLQCRICDIWKTAKTEADIDLPSIKKILSQASDLKIQEIALSGGEPLLRSDIGEIVEHARSLKIKNLGILSNGVAVADNLHKIKPYLIDNTISLVISLDSLDAQLHNRIRNSHLAWQKTTGSLRALSSLKKEFPSVSFHVISIILNDNLEELPALADFVMTLGAQSLQFQVLLPNNLNMAERKKSEFWVSEDRMPVLDAAVEKLVALKQGNPRFIKNSVKNLSLIKKYYRGVLTSDDVTCLSAYKTILASNQGTYTTCFSCYGDIRHGDLKGVLGGRQIIASREKVQKCAWPCLLPCFCD